MGSTFGTYNVAYSGMYVSKAGLTATSNNLSNISTTGASRVRVDSVNCTVDQLDGTTTMSGSDVASVTRARDRFLDATYRDQNASSSYWSVKSGNVAYMQKTLSEFEAAGSTSSTSTTADSSSVDGLQQLVTDFYSSWEELAKDPSSESNRQALTEAGTALVSGMSEIDSQLQQLQTDAVNGVTDGVDSLNKLAGQVTDLNQQITVAEVGGQEASYLRDQRDSLLDQMSSLANISVNESGGVLTVSLGGSTLVNGNTSRTLETSGDGSTTNPLTVKWSDTGSAADIDSGSIKAYQEDADQTGYGAISTVPYNFTASSTSSISNMRQALNDLVTTMATTINTLHSSGTGLDASTGLDFFTPVDSSQPLSISNIEVNPDLVADTDKVAAAASSDSGDNTIADEIYNLSSADNYEVNGLSLNTSGYYAAVIAWVGTTGETAASKYSTQATLVSQVDTQRQSTSSISMDEEMSNLMIYQNAYSASAKVLSTIDGLIGDLIKDL